jgi:hypothetical protein
MAGVVVLGAAGGWACGFVILVFGDFIGRSGNSDASYIGYWAPTDAAVLALFYGLPLGLLLFPIGYYAFLRYVPLKTALTRTTLGTIFAGWVGALIAPLAAALIGSVGFFIICTHVAERAKRR